MANPSSTDLPDGDLRALGLPQKTVEVPPEQDIDVEEEVQQTQPQEEATQEPEPEPEAQEEEASVLDQYMELMEDEEPATPAEDPSLADAKKEIQQLREQLQELISSRDQELKSKASEPEQADNEFDLSSPVIQNYLDELRRSDPEQARQVEARLLQEKIREETKKSTADLMRKLQEKEQEQRAKEAADQMKQRVFEGLEMASRLGGTEAELVAQWNNTPPDRRHLTEIGKQFLADRYVMASPKSVYQMVRARAADINDQVRRGRRTEPVNESTGVSSRSRSKSVAVNSQAEELSPQERERLENEEFAEKLVKMNQLPDGLDFLKPL